MKRFALVSVSDKTGLSEFASELVTLGYTLLASQGTGAYLAQYGVPFETIESYTGQREILDGRVKTLHPKIHGGLLAKRDNDKHLNELKEEGIFPIDIAIINLYPFIQNLSAVGSDPSKMIELIDVGGPTMIRAAAKNFKSVIPLLDPSDYSTVLSHLKEGTVTLEMRRRLAEKVFMFTARYEAEIATYFSKLSYDDAGSPTVDLDQEIGSVRGVLLSKSQALRYGENPHQEAAFYSVLGAPDREWKQLQGKELSYNNLLDFDAAAKLMRAFSKGKATAIIIKHLNPCGVASDETLLAAFQKAKRCDPRSHFGGVLAFSERVTLEVAQAIREDFAEIVIAPSFEPEALTLLGKNKALRVLEVPLTVTGSVELRSIEGGILVQHPDQSISSVDEAKLVTEREPSAREREDLQFAWTACAFVKSNAVVLAKDGMLIGVGAGQMSRVDSAELAISKAKLHQHDLKGAVAASDAFFPFPDSVELLASNGITAIIAPGGAKRDPEVSEAAGKASVSLFFAAERHFKH